MLAFAEKTIANVFGREKKTDKKLFKRSTKEMCVVLYAKNRIVFGGAYDLVQCRQSRQ